MRLDADAEENDAGASPPDEDREVLSMSPPPPLPAVEGGDKCDDVALLQQVVQLTEQLPVLVVDQHQDARADALALEEQFRPLLQQVVADPGEEATQRPRVVDLLGKANLGEGETQEATKG